MSDSILDPYAVLKLPRGSSLDDVRKQYRRLARIYHPDRNPGDAVWCEEQLKELNAAFDLLSDPAKKAACDGLAPRSAMPNAQRRANRPQERPETQRPASTGNNFHEPVSDERPAATSPPQGDSRRKKRSILPLLSASVAGMAAVGAFILAKSLTVLTPSPPESSVRKTPAHPLHAPARAIAAGRHIQAIHQAEGVTRHRSAASHGFHRQSSVSKTDVKSERGVSHPRAVRSHVLTAQQKNTVALRLAETLEARRRTLQSKRLKRISPRAMIRQMQNAARNL